MTECLTVHMNDRCARLCTTVLIQTLLFTRLHRRKSQGWRGNIQGAELVGCLSSSGSQGPLTSQPVFPCQGPSQEAEAQQTTMRTKCLTGTAMWLLEAIEGVFPVTSALLPGPQLQFSMTSEPKNLPSGGPQG